MSVNEGWCLRLLSHWILAWNWRLKTGAGHEVDRSSYSHYHRLFLFYACMEVDRYAVNDHCCHPTWTCMTTADYDKRIAYS